MSNVVRLTNGWVATSTDDPQQWFNAIEVPAYDVIDFCLYACIQGSTGQQVIINVDTNMYRQSGRTGNWQTIKSFKAFTGTAGGVFTDIQSVTSPFGRYLRWSLTGVGGSVLRFFIEGIGRQYR